MSIFFEYYGDFCAKNPWEVIVAIITSTICLFTFDRRLQRSSPGIEEPLSSLDTIIMTFIRCLAILYSFHQFKSLQRIGSKYVLGITGLFIIFSSLVFTTTVISILNVNLIDLKDAIFFFLLLADLYKAATLAQFALTASNSNEVSKKISKGMSILGPTITLDSIVEVLVIGVGTLSGVHRLEILSYYACFSVLVNYVIFMTFYPACLSLVLQLSKVLNYYGEKRNVVTKMLIEENQKFNPAVQRVKLIMSVGLIAVYLYSYWCFIRKSDKIITEISDESSYSYFMKQFSVSTDHVVILIMLSTLIVKFLFFESGDVENLTADAALDIQKLERRKIVMEDVEIQTATCQDPLNFVYPQVIKSPENVKRSLEEILQIYRANLDASSLSDEEVILLIDTKHVPAYNLEKILKDTKRAVRIRRIIIESATNSLSLQGLPFENYDYNKVIGSCCENVVGYVSLPVGIAGPLRLDGNLYYIPMATTEGCLVASTNRGCRAVEVNGVKTRIEEDGMTRAPVIQFASLEQASEACFWIKKPQNYEEIKIHFDSTSRFAKLSKITTRICGRYLFIRFVAFTGDAMGMNMLSKGTERALMYIKEYFPEMKILSLSGNMCTDKKASAINWIEGRGKSVICESIIPLNIVKSVLKTTPCSLIELNIAKNFYGSAASGSMGGFNAQASNIVTALYIATGQDPAQNVCSSNCLTMMEPYGEDLYVACTMPSVEVGTVGGGTVLPAQAACLELLGVRGPSSECPGDNAKQLARIVCGAVMAGELSLMAAQITGDLVRSHLKYNRSYSEGL